MADNFLERHREDYEKRKAEAIAAKTDEPIIAQIMQIKSRMPHRNIPQKYIDDLHTYLSQLYIYLEYRPGQRMYVYESEDKSLSIGLYPLNDGLAAVEYLKN
mgnify:FL=1